MMPMVKWKAIARSKYETINAQYSHPQQPRHPGKASWGTGSPSRDSPRGSLSVPQTVRRVIGQFGLQEYQRDFNTMSM